MIRKTSSRKRGARKCPYQALPDSTKLVCVNSFSIGEQKPNTPDGYRRQVDASHSNPSKVKVNAQVHATNNIVICTHLGELWNTDFLFLGWRTLHRSGSTTDVAAFRE